MDTWVTLILAFIGITFILAIFVFVKHALSKRFNSADVVYVKAHWESVMKIEREDPIKAIMDADKILDYALSRQGFTGSVGEKLKDAASRFSNLEGVWMAHKMRNRLAHEFFEITRAEVSSALKEFKRALKDLGVKL